MPDDKIYCGNCKAELSPSARACPQCGCDPKKAVSYCPNCGEAKVNPNAIICTKCGASLTGGSSSAPKAGAGASTIFCGNCKEQLSSAAKACPKCGSDPRKPVKFCTSCGEPKASETAIICTKCGASLTGGGSGVSLQSGDMSPEVAGILGMVWGLGLYLNLPEDKKEKGLYLVLGLVALDIILTVLTVICAVLFWLVVPILCGLIFVILIFASHIGMGVITYNEVKAMKGDKRLFEWSIMPYLQ